MPQVFQLRFFFSHSSQDGNWVERVAAQARAAGVDVYLAEHDVSPGVHLSEKVTKAIEACDFLVVLLTENSLRSVYVQQEIGVAHRAKKLVIPILMGNLTHADLGILNGVEYIRLDPDDPQEGLTRLSETLTHLIRRQLAWLASQEEARLAKELQERAEALRKQQNQDILLIAGVALLVIGLIYLAQADD